MTMPRPGEAARSLFRAVLPDDPRVQTRPMFGQLAGFVNGHMFAGLYGDRLIVRLPDDQRAALLAEPGAEPFAPMAGRPMREYVMLPAAWQDRPHRLGEWLDHALAWAAALPPKPAKPAKARAPGRA